MRLKSFRAFILLLSTLVVGAVIRPGNKLSLLKNEGFIAYLEVPRNFGAIQHCWYKFRDEPKIKVDLNSTESILTERGEELLPFSSTICGIRVNKVSSASAAVWTLEAENTYGDFEKSELTITILPAQKVHFDTHVQRDIGRSAIECTKHDTLTRYCKIIDNSTGESWKECSILANIRPGSAFDCVTHNWGRMEESQEHIIVDIKNTTLYSTANVEEDSKKVIMRCQFVDSLTTCQAEMPNHRDEIYIMEGLYNGRYSAYDTLKSQKTCALEIPKPLMEAETGLWRIINHESSTATGCIYHIGKTKREIIEAELKRLENVTVLKMFEPEQNSTATIPEISCTVPFVVDNCYLRDPNNTVYFPESYQFQRQRLYGKCGFSRMPVVAGIWTCGLRGHDFEKEVVQDIEVIVKPKNGEVLTDQVKAKKGDSVELMCRSAFEEPLTYCAFVDPAGDVHLVGTASSVKTVGQITYFGRGLEWGDCGIKISEVIAKGFGAWKCQFVIASGKTNSAFVLYLKESALGHATSVGLGIGVTVMLVLVAGVIIGTVFYRRRNSTVRHSFPSTDPLSTSSSPMETQETQA